MRHANFITLYVGLFVIGGYVLGSFARHWTRPDPDAPEENAAIAGRAMVEGAAAVLWGGIAYLLIDLVAPGTSDFRNTSAIGFLSGKALTVWESAALWAGLAVVVGAVAPLPTRGRDGSRGLAASGALLATYSPITLLIAAAAVFAGANVLRSTRAGFLVGFLTIAAAEWVLSMVRIRLGVGFINGPETSLWAVVLAGVLIARWSHPTASELLEPDNRQ